MERTLVLSAFAVGWLGWLFGMLGTWSGRGSAAPGRVGLPRASLAACLLVPLIVFLATLPQHPPFASGQGFGRGFVIGALGALLAGWLIGRTNSAGKDRGDGLQSAAAAIGPYFMAAAVVAMPLLWMHSVLTDALLGAAIGWLVNSIFLLVAPSDPGDAPSETTAAQIVNALTIGLGFMATLAIAVALGDYRGGVRFGAAIAPVSWRAITLGYGACIPCVMLLCALPTAWVAGLLSRLPLSGLFLRAGDAAIRSEAARNALVRTWRLLPASALLALFARLLSTRLDHHPPLLSLTGFGLIACIVAWWLTDRIAPASEIEGETRRLQRQNAALAVVVVMCAAMAAYQMFAGVGVGLVLLAAWLVAGLAQLGNGSIDAAERRSDGEPVGERGVALLPALIGFGVLVEVYRFLLVRFGDDLRGVQLADHYALFGFIIGAIVPLLLVDYLLASNSKRPRNASETILRTVVAGALVLAVPAVMLMLFGAKCELALCFGLALGSALPMLRAGFGKADAARDRNDEPNLLMAVLPFVLALAVGLALAQWTGHVLPLALYSRAAKLRLIGYLVGAMIALLLASDIVGRYHDRRWGRLNALSGDDQARRAVQ